MGPRMTWPKSFSATSQGNSFQSPHHAISQFSILPLFNPGPVGAAHGFALDRRVPEAAQFRNIPTHFENRVGDIVHVFSAAEEKMVGKPNRFFVRRALGDRAAVAPAQIEGLRTAPTERGVRRIRSEEHTSELQSPYDLVCRL